MKRRIYIGFIYYLTLIYLEIVFRVVCTENIFPITFINNLIFLLPVTLFLIIISSLLTPKVNAIIAKIITFILCLWYAICLVFKNKFGVYFSLSAIGLANQLKSFTRLNTNEVVVTNLGTDTMESAINLLDTTTEATLEISNTNCNL